MGKAEKQKRTQDAWKPQLWPFAVPTVLTKGLCCTQVAGRVDLLLQRHSD